MASKLRAILNGHKGAVSRIFSKFEATQEDLTNVDDLQTTEESLKRKLQTISDLHEKIIDTLPEQNVEEIEAEVLEQEEYIYSLQSKLQKVRSCIKVCVSNLDINAHTGNRLRAEQTQNARIIPPVSGDTQDRSNYHRLLKLELSKFHGNVMEWQAFWDSFESAIHENTSLSSVQKFNYLRSTLRGEALHTVAGFAITNANYEKAVSLLHERYGKKDKIIQTYMMALLDIPAPVNTFASLRGYKDSAEIYIRGLDSLGQTEDTYGSLLVPVIIQKLPSEIRRNIIRAHGKPCILGDLMRYLLDEVNILDAGSTQCNTADFVYTPVHQDFATTTTLLTKTENRCSERRRAANPNNPVKSTFQRIVRICVFCKRPHASTHCREVSDHDQRIKIVKKDRLCFNCLGRHKIANCKSKFKCKVCARRHHTSICTGKTTNTTRKGHETGESQKSILHHTHATSTVPILLKTAVATVQSYTRASAANILFDEGAQSSFITEKLAQKLRLTPTSKETLCLSGFGDTERQTRHLESATLYLHAENENSPIKVLIVPEISAPLKIYRRQVQQLAYLTGLKLTHSVGEEEDFEIELLIGADQYWNAVQENVRGDGPTAVQSKLDYLVSGPLSTQTTETVTSLPKTVLNVLSSGKQCHKLEVGDEVQIQDDVLLKSIWSGGSGRYRWWIRVHSSREGQFQKRCYDKANQKVISIISTNRTVINYAKYSE